MAFLKGIKEKKRKRLIMVLTIILSFLLSSGIDEVITRPSDLISKMPAAVGEQFQGEWALYSASMLTAALTNISMIYPETRREAANGTYFSSSLPVKGSYSALNCYYLTFIDDEFARGQYEILKTRFINMKPITGFKEYFDRNCWFGVDIDAGPIIFNLSPTGTAFGIGSITYFEDFELRKRFLKTAELAGFTVNKDNKRQYLLADLALVGEAITLAMRTAVPWK